MSMGCEQFLFWREILSVCLILTLLEAGVSFSWWFQGERKSSDSMWGLFLFFFINFHQQFHSLIIRFLVQIWYSSSFKNNTISYMKLRGFTFLILLASMLLVSEAVDQCKKLHFLPMPRQIQCGEGSFALEDPCKMLFHVKLNEQGHEHIEELIGFQLKKTLHCQIPNIVIAPALDFDAAGFSYKIEVQIKDPAFKSVFTAEEEQYEIAATLNGATLKSMTFVGFVRGLQTFMQSIRCPRHKYNNCKIVNLPLTIKDQPFLTYRGLMVDTSRHFIPMKILKETMDAMMYNKLNVFHWHIVDQDSFPLILDSHPEIAQYASYSPDETYSTQDARELVAYAMRRGVRVVPELDTPGHAASWGLAPENKGVACTFGSGFMGPLDVTLDKTYKLVEEVFAQIFDIFPDPIVHLGGDEVVLTCLTNKTEFLAKEGIRDNEIQRHYRRKQHKILANLNPNKKFMYWMNSGDIQIEEGDIVHWWGGGVPTTKHEVVMSQYGPYYLDMGVGNYLGVSYGNYQTWLDLFNIDIGKMIENYSNKQNVLGAEVCLWSELNNQYIHHMKIWIRSSSFAEKAWSPEQLPAKPDGLGRIAAHEQLMNSRGIPTAGATSQQCETFPEYC